MRDLVRQDEIGESISDVVDRCPVQVSVHVRESVQRLRRLDEEPKVLHRVPVTACLGSSDLTKTDNHGTESVGILVKSLIKHSLTAPFRFGVAITKKTLGTHGPGIVNDLKFRSVGLEDSKLGLEILWESNTLVSHSLVLSGLGILSVGAIQADDSANIFKLGESVDEMATKTTRCSSDEDDVIILSKSLFGDSFRNNRRRDFNIDNRRCFNNAHLFGKHSSQVSDRLALHEQLFVSNIQVKRILEATCNDQRQKRINTTVGEISVIVQIGTRNTTLFRDDLKGTLKLDINGLDKLLVKLRSGASRRVGVSAREVAKVFDGGVFEEEGVEVEVDVKFFLETSGYLYSFSKSKVSKSSSDPQPWFMYTSTSMSVWSLQFMAKPQDWVRESMTAGCFKSFAVEHDFVNGTVVIVETRKGTDHAIGHGAVEASAFTGGNLFTKSLHLLLRFLSLRLQGFLVYSILVADDTGRVFLKITLVLLRQPVSFSMSLDRLLGPITPQDQSLRNSHVRDNNHVISVLGLILLEKVFAQSQTNVCVHRRGAKRDTIDFMSLNKRTQVLASNVRLDNDVCLVRVAIFLNNAMDGGALKFGRVVDDQRRIALSECPVIDILDPVILELPAISWKGNDRVHTWKATLCLECSGEHLPWCSATLEGGNACYLLAESGLDHARNSRMRTNFEHHVAIADCTLPISCCESGKHVNRENLLDLGDLIVGTSKDSLDGGINAGSLVLFASQSLGDLILRPLDHKHSMRTSSALGLKQLCPTTDQEEGISVGKYTGDIESGVFPKTVSDDCTWNNAPRGPELA
ncbi:hypothetical protein HG531_008498 [Fusarium graminearum]|nr:hypothetical protein HG531_008498 [Fusarium graminearum]